MARQSVGFVSIGRSIFPVILAIDDLAIERAIARNNPLILSEIVEGIIVCYVRETESNLELVTEAHLEPYMMNREDIIKAAKRNLTERVRESAKIRNVNPLEVSSDTLPFYRGILDKKFDTSLMVVDEFWERAAEMLKSEEIAISIPARNALYFCDLNNKESFKAMLPIADQMFEKSLDDNLQLSQNKYIRQNGKWILFSEKE